MNPVTSTDKGSDASAGGKLRVESAARAIRVLVAVARSDAGLAAKNIAAELGLPRQVVYHLLHTLVQVQALAKTNAGTYTLGMGVMPLVGAFSRHVSPQAHLLPLVRRISAETGETAYAAGWIGNEIMVVATSSGSNPIQAAEVALGNCGFANARASSKLLLALSTEPHRKAFLTDNPPVQKTAKSIVRLDELEREFTRIRELGYAMDDEEFTEGVCCLAVPLAQSEGLFALGLSAPTNTFYANKDRYLAAVRSAAGAVAPPAANPLLAAN